MAGEELAEAFVGFSGVYGDRCYAFRDSAARKGFPYLNANVQQRMLLYRPRFRHPERAAAPPNLSEAQAIAPGVTPAGAGPGDMDLDVVTPEGGVVPIDDPGLMEMLREGLGGEHRLSLVRSDRALTDCRPLSLISMQTVRQVEGELGVTLDKRRFRANIYINLAAGSGFGEDGWVGRKLRIGDRAVVAVLERDPRCKMISLDPDTGGHDPGVLRKVAQAHEASAGVYCAVMVEGVVSKGDPVEAID
ncbi:MAG TPA: MOSC domain-containing protein [Pyrinomonadaceae bacterium]|nr:MOSC domain-containing protein [Pyrinomonadaceae bacterium]